MTDLQQAVLNIVRRIPTGKVMSYGQVAAYLGLPRAARQVGWVMRSLEGTPDFPWWRVLNNSGRITIKGNQFNTAQTQKELLESEAVEVSETFELDMKKYRFLFDRKTIQGLSLDAAYIDTVLARYGIG